MTKEQAIEAMMAGEKVTHRFFEPHEWITMKGSLIIVTEEGYSITATEFWRFRSSEEWQSDWSIWSEK